MSTISTPKGRAKAADHRALLKIYMEYQVLGLSKMVGKVGGAKVTERLDEILIIAANKSGWPLSVQRGRFKSFDTNQPWSVYRQVMQAAVDFAVNIYGKPKIKDLFQQVLQALEQKTGERYSEIDYRLNLHF